MIARFAVAIFVLAGTAADAHRLDEYLQGTLLSVDRDRMEAQVTLTPGVAVFPYVMREIDRDGNGVVSEQEQQAYADRVRQDLSFAIDGERLSLHLHSMQFPTVAEMKEGRGEIRLDFEANLPGGGRSRKLAFENHHMSTVAAYLVNAVAPSDPRIRIEAQKRNYTQSVYELDYQDLGAPSVPSFLWMSPFALLLCLRLPLRWRKLHLQTAFLKLPMSAESSGRK